MTELSDEGARKDLKRHYSKESFKDKGQGA